MQECYHRGDTSLLLKFTAEAFGWNAMLRAFRRKMKSCFYTRSIRQRSLGDIESEICRGLQRATLRNRRATFCPLLHSLPATAEGNLVNLAHDLECAIIIITVVRLSVNSPSH